MFIQTEETPNPLALKFIPGKQVMGEGTFSVTSKEDAWQCPLIESLFRITGVAEVFLSSDFISVTKTAEYDYNQTSNTAEARMLTDTLCGDMNYGCKVFRLCVQN